MRNIITTGLISILIISCNQITNNSKHIDKNADFYVFYDKLNKLNLPIISKCANGNYSMTKFDLFTTDDLIKFRPKDYYIYGKIDFKDFNTVLYGFPGDYPMPMIIVFKNGFPTDTLDLYTTDCGSDLENESTSSCIIDQNFNITIQDTLIKYQIDETDDIIDGLTDTTVIIKKYLLDKTGKFIEN